MEQPKDIFQDITEAAEEDAKNTTVDLGPLNPLISRQIELEAKTDLGKVNSIYDEVCRTSASVSDVEEALKRLKKDLFKIKQVQIPEFLKGLGIRTIETDEGFTIEIKGDVSVSVKDKVKLYQFIKDQKHGDIIKDSLKVEFGEITEAEWEGLQLYMDKNINCSYERSEAVHAQTLKKFVRTMLKDGITIPPEFANIYEYEYSNLKKGK